MEATPNSYFFPSALCSLLSLLFWQRYEERVVEERGKSKGPCPGCSFWIADCSPELSHAVKYQKAWPVLWCVLQDRVMWCGCWCLEEDLTVTVYGSLESSWVLKLSRPSLCSVSGWKAEVVAWTVSWCLWTLFFSTYFSLRNVKPWA